MPGPSLAIPTMSSLVGIRPNSAAPEPRSSQPTKRQHISSGSRGKGNEDREGFATGDEVLGGVGEQAKRIGSARRLRNGKRETDERDIMPQRCHVLCNPIQACLAVPSAWPAGETQFSTILSIGCPTRREKDLQGACCIVAGLTRGSLEGPFSPISHKKSKKSHFSRRKKAKD